MKVIAAIDGSSFSNLVVKELSLRKWAEGSIIKLVTVLDTNGGHYSDFLQCAKTALEDTAQYFSQLHPHVQFLPEIQYGHNVAQKLLELANEWYAELIIVASHGNGGLRQALLGSVSEYILDHAMIPVVIAKEEPLSEQSDSVNILIPTDNSKFSIEAMNWFSRQTWTIPINLKLMTVLPPLSDHYASESDTNKAMEMLTQQQNIKDEVMATFEQWGSHFQKCMAPATLDFGIYEGNPHDEIILEAQEWSANLIVMGSHGRTGLKRVLIGSVAKAVSQRASCSVEVVRVPDFADYTNQWEAADRKTHLDDLRKRGDLNMPKTIGTNW